MKTISKLKSSSLVTGTSTYLFAGLINAAIPFLLLPILTRHLEPSEYGQIAVFQVWIALIGVLCGLSVHGAAVRKYYDYEEPEKHMGEFISSCLVLLIISTTTIYIIIAPFSKLLSEYISLPQAWIMIGVPIAFFNFIIQIRLGQWQVRKNPKKYGTFQISRSLLDMTLSLTFVVALTMGFTGRLSGQSIAIVIFGITGFIFLYNDGLVKKVWRPDLMREALEFGIPLIPHIVGAFLLLTIDRAIISAKLGSDAAGFYMVAAQLAMVMSLMLDSVNKAFVPWLFERLKRDSRKEKQFIVKLSYGYSAFLLFCALLAFLIGENILIILAGEKYAPAGKLIAWLVLAQAFRGMYFMVSNYIFYAKKTGTIAKITITSGLINVTLMIFLIDMFGLIGAAWAACFSMAFQFTFTWLASARLIPMPWFGDR